MGLTNPFTGSSTLNAGFGYGGGPAPSSGDPAQSSFGGSSGLKNSYEQNPPERLDVNQIAQGLAPKDNGIDLSGAAKAGLQIADIFGRGPAFFAERPAATVQAAFQTVAPKFHIPVLSEIGDIAAGTVGFAGDVLRNIDTFVPAILQMRRADMLRQTAGLDPNTPITDSVPAYSLAGLFAPQAKTVGELRAEAFRLGYTQGDINNLKAGKTSAWDYGDKSLLDNPVLDLAAKLVFSPSTWAMFVFPPLAVASRYKTFKTLVAAGAQLEKPVAVELAAAAVAKGVAKEATWQGMGHYAGLALRQPGVIKTIDTAAKVYKANLKVGIGLGIGEAAISSISGGAETPKSGFMAPLLELNQKAFDNQPLSTNVAFMLFAAHNFGWTKLIKGVGEAYHTASYRIAGSQVELRMIEALAEGQGLKSFAAKRKFVYERIGGKDALAEFIIHVHKGIEFEKISPELGKTFSHFASMDEAALKGSSLGRMLQEKVKLGYETDAYNATDTVDMAKRWFGNRRGPKGEPMNPVEFPWQGGDAMDEWRRYVAAVEPMVETLNKRLEGIGVAGDVPFPVIQLTKELSRDELSNGRLSLALRVSEDGTIANADVRELLTRLPQLTEKNFDKQAFWSRILTNTDRVAFKDISKRLKNLEKDAPSVRQITDPQAIAEAAASHPEAPALKPLTSSEANPHVTVDHSQFRPGNFGVDAGVPAAINALGSRAAQRAASNVVQTMRAAGFAVKDAASVLGSNGKAHLQVILDSGSIEELRVAVAMVGRSIGAESSIMTVTGERLARLNIRANAIEIVYQVPHLSAMDEVSALMKQYLPDFTLDPTTGTVRAMVRQAGSEDLPARLEAIKVGLAKVFKADDAGNNGVVRSMSGAYIEKIGRARATNDFTYQSIAKSTGHDPRWGAERLVKEGISQLPADAPVDVASRLGSLTDVGGAQGAGPLRAPSGPAVDPAITQQWLDAGATQAGAEAASILTSIRAETMGVHPSELMKNVRVIASDKVPANAMEQRLATAPDDAARLLILEEAPPPWLQSEAGDLARAEKIETFHAGDQTIHMPGGLDGTLSVWDATRLRWQAIGAKALAAVNPGLSIKIYRKMFASMTRSLEDPMETFRVVTFALLSPRTDFIVNEGRAIAMRMRTPADIIAFADRYDLLPAVNRPTKYVEGLLRKRGGGIPEGPKFSKPIQSEPQSLRTLEGKPTPAQVQELGKQVARDMGMPGNIKGLDEHFGNLVLAARMYRDHPQLFTRQAGQDLNEFADRLMNVTRGAGLKVGTFGPMLADPINATRGTIDVHMVRFINKFIDDNLPFLKSREIEKGLEEGTLTRKLSVKVVKDADGVGEPVIPGPREVVFRKADGTINQEVPSYLHDLEPFLGDNKISIFKGSEYERANLVLAVDQELAGTASSFGLGGHQWWRWDQVRPSGRIEPHVMVYPKTYGVSQGPLFDVGGGPRQSVSGGIAELTQKGFSGKAKGTPGYLSTPRGILYLQGSDAASARGYTLMRESETVIGLTKHADPSTAVHEWWHGIGEPSLSGTEQRILARHGAHGEAGARMFERYLRDGHAPTQALAQVFERIAIMMKQVYQRLKGTPIEKQIHPEVRGVFDRAFGAPLAEGVSAEEFSLAITAARALKKSNGRGVGETVAQYTTEEYAGMKTFLTADGKTGYAIKPDGDLVSLFNVGEGGKGSLAVAEGIKRGGTKLDAFDEGGFLPDIYGRHGFVETSRYPWDPQYMPEGWTGGTPDVVYMEQAKPPVLIAGIGEASKAKVEPGHVYHVTDQGSLESIAKTGLKAKLPNEAVSNRTAWTEGGSGKRLWLGQVPSEAITQTGARPGQAMLRIKQSDAGQLRMSPTDGTQFTMKSVPSSMVEVYGGDGAWHRLDTFMESPLGTVPPDLSASAAEVSAFWDRIPVGSRPDNISQALRFQSDAAMAARAGLSEPEVAAIQQAVYDAAVAKGYQTIKLHGAWATAPDAVKTQLEAFNTMLRRELPGYELGPSPKLAWLHDATDIPVVGALRQREGLLLWLSTDSPLAPLGRLKDWLFHAEPNSKFGAAARNALATSLIKNGATAKEVDLFTRELRSIVDSTQVSKSGVKLFPQITSLPAYMIERTAARVFNKAFLAKVGAKNVYKLLDQAGNRFTRGVILAEAGGKKVGRLSRALNTVYHVGQNTPVVKDLRYLKSFYHTFRFTLDVRWHAMNATEADIIGGLGYGQVRHGHPGLAPEGSAFASHAGGVALTDMAATTGWYFPRHLENVISRSFDAARPESTLNVLKALDESDLIALWKHFPDTTGDIRNLAQALDNQLYNFDSVGVKAALEAEAKAQSLTAYSGELGRDITNEQIAPVLQRLYEVNDSLYRDIVNAFEGNTSRTNLERIANSYFLYWPLSYQLKAGKWMFDVMTKRIAGKSTVGAGAVTYKRLLDAHREAMATDESYANMFNDNPTLWFFAQMLLPITPGDLGVSLSRPVRYAGTMLRNATGGDQGPLGFWGDYKAAQDPMTAILAMAEMGPLYTAKALGKIHNELIRATAEPKTTFAPSASSSRIKGPSLADLGVSTAPAGP